MISVVTGRCIACRHTDCVAVCPVDCFHEIDDPPMLVIDPETCTGCGACIPVCPVEAIFDEADVPQAYQAFIAFNAGRWRDGRPISVTKGPLATARPLEEILEEEKAGITKGPTSPGDGAWPSPDPARPSR